MTKSSFLKYTLLSFFKNLQKKPALKKKPLKKKQPFKKQPFSKKRFPKPKKIPQTSKTDLMKELNKNAKMSDSS